MPQYALFGLHLQSDLPLPGIQPVATSSVPDVRVQLVGPSAKIPADHDGPPWYVSPHLADDHVPLLRMWRPGAGRYYRLLYADGTEFRVAASGDHVWGTWREPYCLEDLATYLLGPVLGFVLRIRGVICLHASAVTIHGRAVAFVGHPGAGKSTTAAALARRGFPVLADDAVALRPAGDAILVESAYPGLRLWPDAVEALYGTGYTLPRLTPNWDKRHLDLTTNGYRFQAQALPLGAVYLLEDRRPFPEPPAAEPVTGQAALLRLVAQTYTNYMLDRQMRAREFALLGRLAHTVPLRLLFPPAEAARLPELCDLILRDCLASDAGAAHPLAAPLHPEAPP